MMASARGPICPRGTPGGSAAGSTAPQPAHTPLYSRYSLTSGRIGGMSNTWCRSGLPRTLTVPPQVHTGGGTQSCTRWTSDSGSRARNAPGWPFCAPRLRALALRCARLPRPGPSEDGGLDELRESSARRSSRRMTLSRSEASSPASASITAWHCSTVAGLLTPTTPRPASPPASLCMRTVSGQNHELTSAISTELADDAAAPRWHSRGGAEYVRHQLHPAQRLQRLHQRGQAPAGQQLAQRGLEPSDARGRLGDRVQVLLEGDLLRGVRQLHAGEPAQVRGRPRGLAGVADAVAQQQRFEAMARAALLAHRVLARTHHVAHRLVDQFGHAHRAQVVRARQAGQRDCVAPISLDPLARCARDRRGRGHLALDAMACEVAPDDESPRTGLVHHVQPPTAADEPAQRLVQRAQVPANLPQVANLALAAGLGNRDLDAVLVHIQPDVQNLHGSFHGPSPCKLATTRPTSARCIGVARRAQRAQSTVLQEMGRPLMRSHSVWAS